MPERDPEYNTSNKCCNADSSVHPDEFWIDGDGRKGDRKSRSKGGGEQEHGHDEGLHARWGLRISIFETGDGGEDLRESNEDVRRDLNADVHSTWVLARGEIITGTRRVDPVLQNC